MRKKRKSNESHQMSMLSELSSPYGLSNERKPKTNVAEEENKRKRVMFFEDLQMTTNEKPLSNEKQMK